MENSGTKRKLAILVIGGAGEGKSLTCNLLAGSKVFQENDTSAVIENQPTHYDDHQYRIIDLPALSLDNGNLEQGFKYRADLLAQTISLIGDREVAILVCKSAMATRLELPLIQMLLCIKATLQADSFLFLATNTDMLTPEERLLKLDQFSQQLPQILSEQHQIIVYGSLERDLSGDFAKDPVFSNFMKKTINSVKVDHASMLVGLFNYWRKLYFYGKLAQFKDSISQDKQKEGASFFDAFKAATAISKELSQTYETNFVPRFSDQANLRLEQELSQDLLTDNFNSDLLPEMQLLKKSITSSQQTPLSYIHQRSNLYNRPEAQQCLAESAHKHNLLHNTQPLHQQLPMVHFNQADWIANYQQQIMDEAAEEGNWKGHESIEERRYKEQLVSEVNNRQRQQEMLIMMMQMQTEETKRMQDETAKQLNELQSRKLPDGYQYLGGKEKQKEKTRWYEKIVTIFTREHKRSE